MPSRLNKLMVEELAEKFRQVDTCIFVDFTGLTGRKAADLRHQLQATCGQAAAFTMVKASLAKRAFAQIEGMAALADDGLLDELTTGPTGIAYGSEDPVQAARTLPEWSKKERVLRFKGGLLAGRPLAAEAVAELAKIPPKHILMARVVGTIAAPLTSLLRVAQGPIRKLLGLADALAEQNARKETESD